MCSLSFPSALTLDGLATAVGLSRATLCRNFRRACHSTPMRYARRLRLDHAADLLRSTESSVGAIAMVSGFRDVYYFSRAFREAYGCTPTAWRKGLDPDASAVAGVEGCVHRSCRVRINTR